MSIQNSYRPECRKMDENRPKFLIQVVAKYSKIHVNFWIFCPNVLYGKLNIISSLKTISSSACSQENCENSSLDANLPLSLSLLPRNVDVVLQILLRHYVTMLFRQCRPHFLSKSMHLYCDVTSLCKFGMLKSYLFLILS